MAEFLQALDRLLLEPPRKDGAKKYADLRRRLRQLGLEAVALHLEGLDEAPAPRRFKSLVEARTKLAAAVTKLVRPRYSPSWEPLQEGGILHGSPEATKLSDVIPLALNWARRDQAWTRLAQVEDFSKASLGELEILLSNGDTRAGTLRGLARAPKEQRQAWIEWFRNHGHLWVRQASYELLEGIPGLELAALLQPSWSRPSDQARARICLRSLGSDVAHGFRNWLKEAEATPAVALGFALERSLPALSSEDRSWLEELSGRSPEVDALLELARVQIGVLSVQELEGVAATHEASESRSLAGAKLWQESKQDPKLLRRLLDREGISAARVLTWLQGSQSLGGLSPAWRSSLLPHQDLETRQKALQEIEAGLPPDTVALVAPSLVDPHESVRAQAVRIQAHFEGISPLFRAFEGLEAPAPEPGPGGTAARRDFQSRIAPLLSKIPDRRFLPWLRDTLLHSSPEALPQEVLEAFGPLLAPIFAEVLEDPDQREGALSAMLRVYSIAECLELLDRVDASEDPIQRALTRLPHEEFFPAGSALLEPIDAERAGALLQLAKSKKAVRPPLLRILAREGYAPALELFLKLLGSPLPEMVPGTSPNRSLRWTEKAWIEDILFFDSQVLPGLERALTSENWTVRHHAAWLLAILEAPEAAQALATCLGRDPEPEVRLACLKALGRSSGPAAAEALEAWFQEGPPEDRLHVLRALEALEPKLALAILPRLELAKKDLALRRELERVQRQLEASK